MTIEAVTVRRTKNGYIVTTLGDISAKGDEYIAKGPNDLRDVIVDLIGDPLASVDADMRAFLLKTPIGSSKRIESVLSDRPLADDGNPFLEGSAQWFEYRSKHRDSVRYKLEQDATLPTDPLA